VRSSQLSYRPVQEYAGKKDKINLAARIPLVKVQWLDCQTKIKMSPSYQS
jgi:hypothetical protein